MAIAALGAALAGVGGYLGAGTLVGGALLTVGTSLIGQGLMGALSSSLSPDSDSGNNTAPAPPQLAPPPPIQYAPPPPQLQVPQPQPQIQQPPPQKPVVEEVAKDQTANIKERRRERDALKEHAQRNRVRRSGSRTVKPTTLAESRIDSSQTNLVTLLS